MGTTYKTAKILINLRYQTKNHVLILQISLHTLRNSYTDCTIVIVYKTSTYLQYTTIMNAFHTSLFENAK